MIKLSAYLCVPLSQSVTGTRFLQRSQNDVSSLSSVEGLTRRPRTDFILGGRLSPGISSDDCGRRRIAVGRRGV